ncbi:hypothetical protein ABFS83_06G158500 [Erythranthe nasuta]
MNPDARFKYRETAFRIDKINKLLEELEYLNKGKLKKKKKKKKRNSEEVDPDSQIRVEMLNRIDKIRRILDKLKRSEEEEDSEEEDSEEEAAAAAEEEEEDSDEDSDEKLRQISPSVGDEQLIYYNIDDCKTVKRLKEYAKVALGYFNVTDRIIYYVVDVIKANKYLSSGCVSLSLTFTATNRLREATTFESRISFKVGLTEVEFIRVVPT